jgi:ureidoglycolate lyase
MTVLTARPLERTAFAPFGQVLAHQPGDPLRNNFAAALVSDRAGARPNLRVQRTAPTALPLTVRVIERHRHSSQTFAPLSGSPYLVVVFPSDGQGAPRLQDGQAFIARGDQAVNYDRDVWHTGFAALGEGGVFLMLRWDDGTPGDEEFLPLITPLSITADQAAI